LKNLNKIIEEIKKIQLTEDEEIELKRKIETVDSNSVEDNKVLFEIIKDSYKDFDFSVLKEFNKDSIENIRAKFFLNEELAQRPLLAYAYAFYRNGFLGDYFNDKTRVIDTKNKDVLKAMKEVPEALITQDGMLYGVGKDGHEWLYIFLKMSGIDIDGCLRYGSFTHGGVTQQFFSLPKELENRKKGLYLSKEQALAINNLRLKYNPDIKLQEFLMQFSANLGFVVGDTGTALDINFETFTEVLPNEFLDKETIKDRKFQDKFLYR